MTDSSQQSEPQSSLKQTLARSALMFEADILDQLVEREPENVAYLAALGQAFSKLKKHERGLAVDKRLVVTRPSDPSFRYNLACSLVLTGDLDGACRELMKAIDLGYRDFAHLYRDTDLVNLRSDARFRAVKRRIAEVEPKSA
jgi:predicted Zn-dependent protease